MPLGKAVHCWCKNNQSCTTDGYVGPQHPLFSAAEVNQTKLLYKNPCFSKRRRKKICLEQESNNDKQRALKDQMFVYNSYSKPRRSFQRIVKASKSSRFCFVFSHPDLDAVVYMPFIRELLYVEGATLFD